MRESHLEFLVVLHQIVPFLETGVGVNIHRVEEKIFDLRILMMFVGIAECREISKGLYEFSKGRSWGDHRWVCLISLFFNSLILAVKRQLSNHEVQEAS